jgi:preprotein translocase subunit SecG
MHFLGQMFVDARNGANEHRGKSAEVMFEETKALFILNRIFWFLFVAFILILFCLTVMDQEEGALFFGAACSVPLIIMYLRNSRRMEAVREDDLRTVLVWRSVRKIIKERFVLDALVWHFFSTLHEDGQATPFSREELVKVMNNIFSRIGGEIEHEKKNENHRRAHRLMMWQADLKHVGISLGLEVVRDDHAHSTS